MSSSMRNVAAAFVTLGALVFLPAASTAARADGMEPKAEAPAPKPVKKIIRTHRHVAYRRHIHAPRMGYEIKHLHDDLGSPVYAMPDWPACQYVLDGYLAGPTAYRYEGRWDCGS